MFSVTDPLPYGAKKTVTLNLQARSCYAEGAKKCVTFLGASYYSDSANSSVMLPAPMHCPDEAKNTLKSRSSIAVMLPQCGKENFEVTLYDHSHVTSMRQRKL